MKKTSKFSAVLLLCALTSAAQMKTFNLNDLKEKSFTEFLSGKKVIVIGEMHGTTEVPMFVLNLVQQLHTKANPVTVGLEIESNYQKELDVFMKDGDFNKLIAIDYFKTPDGRTSVAMGELIKGLRELKGIQVRCFDIPAGTDESLDRDSLMSINLNSAYHHDGQMIILTGNLHANLKEGYWRANFKSAVFRFNTMNSFGDKLISLNTYFGGGTIWNCMRDGCKERDVHSNSELQKYGTKYIGVYKEVFNGYSGLIYFDKVTASKPLIVQ